jgi:thymidylate kinase
MTRGRLVVFDRYAHDALLATRGSALRRIGRGTLARSLPAPDLTLVLDAPAEVLAARRPGTSLDVLAQRRRGYLELARREGFGVVDATDPPGQMRRRVTARVWRTYLDRAERRSR